jgi:tetratricopeptide (TPR) repeat protein
VKAAVALLALLVLVRDASAEPADEIEDLARAGIERNFAGDFEGANAIWRQLRERFPDHPAAPVLEVDTLYWQQLFDELDTRYDAAIERGGREGVSLAEAWLASHGESAEGEYYLGRALLHLCHLDGVRGRILRAGRRGERAREHLEHALALDPAFVDARYPLGLYDTYVALLSHWSRWLGFLPFVPSGDREAGLQYLEETARAGGLHRLEAALALANVRIYFEPEPGSAVATMRDLHARFPRNALLHFELIEALFAAGRYDEVETEALGLEAHPGADALDAGRRAMARVWRARAELYRGRPAEAWETLASFGPEGMDHPLWGDAWVQLTRGQILDALHDRERAIDCYRRVDGSRRASALAREGLRLPFHPPPERIATNP